MAVVSKKFWKALAIKSFALLCLFIYALGNAGCDKGADFSPQQVTEGFIQNYLPSYLDILWMVDDRSPMSYAKANLVKEAKEFFTKLDSVTLDYRMAFVSADMELHPGLKPNGNPIILRKDYGTVDQRATYFGNLVSAIVNLKTGARNQGFESVLSVLKTSFQPRPGVPLVIVFISDSDDSFNLSTKKPVQYYRDQFLALKGNNPDLLRVYSVNYTAGGQRCATYYNADIDRAGFEDRYFSLANQLSGETGDLCDNFSDQIDITGLRLEELKDRMQLIQRPNLSTLVVKFFMGNAEVAPLGYHYEASTNEIIFDTTPPEGMRVLATFLPQ